MAVRIPGRQPTLGLDAFFLPPYPPSASSIDGSAEAILQPYSDYARYYADAIIDPSAGPVHDTAALEQDQADTQQGVDDHSNRVVVDTDGAAQLLPDNVSQNFGGIDSSVDAAGAGLGSSPVAHIGEGPIDIEYPPGPGDPGGPPLV